MFLKVFAQSEVEKTLSDYPDFFLLQKTVQIPNDEFVSTITSLSVFEDSLLLLTDQMNQKVFWLNTKSDQIKELNPEKCHPGFENLPIHAFFRNDGSVFYMNSGNLQGYWFKKNGECGGRIHDRYTASAPPFIDAFGDKKMIRLEIPPYDIENPVLEVMNEFGEVEQSFGIKLDLPYLAYRYVGGGVVSTSDKKLYVTEPGSSRISEINIEGGAQSNSRVFEPEYLTPFPTNDLEKTRDPQKIFKYFNGVFKKQSVVNSMHGLSKRLLVQQVYFSDDETRRVAFLFYDRLSNMFGSWKIIVDQGFMLAKNGKLYVVNAVDDKFSGELINPSISIFKYIGPEEIVNQ